MSSHSSEGDDLVAALRRRLGTPQRRLDLSDALPRLLVTDVVVESPLPTLFEDLPELPDRVRGAWGRGLERQVQMRRPSAWPTAWDVFFGDAAGVGGDGLRPFVIRTDVRGTRLSITVRLFGFADLWLEETIAALEDALARGVAIRQYGRHRVRIENGKTSIHRRWGATSRAVDNAVTLRLQTPLSLRRGDAFHGSLARLSGSLLRRLYAIGRWNDLSIAAPKGLGTPLVVLDDRTRAEGWDRYSSTHTNGMAVVGLVGQATVRVTSDALGALLVAGETLHAGGNATAGFGRYNVV